LVLTGCAPDITETDFFSRHPEDIQTGPSEVVLLDHQQNGVQIKLTAGKTLHWGPNTVQVESSGNPTNIRISAYLDTGTDLISSPIPYSEYDNNPLIFVTAPDGVEGTWMLELEYTTGAGSFVVRQPISVEEGIWVQHVEDSPLYVSWISPVSPVAGTEQLEFAIHRFDGRAFLPVPDAILDLYPYMDMGAGDGHSAPYEAPVHTGGGRYVGSVNFIMSGGWDLTVKIGSNPTSAQSVIFKGFTVR